MLNLSMSCCLKLTASGNIFMDHKPHSKSCIKKQALQTGKINCTSLCNVAMQCSPHLLIGFSFAVRVWRQDFRYLLFNVFMVYSLAAVLYWDGGYLGLSPHSKMQVSGWPLTSHFFSPSLIYLTGQLL